MSRASSDFVALRTGLPALRSHWNRSRGVEKMSQWYDCTSRVKWFLGAWMSMNEPPEGVNAGVSFLT